MSRLFDYASVLLLIWSVALVVSISGCSKTDNLVSPVTGNEPVEIRLKGGIALSDMEIKASQLPVTRAIINKTHGELNVSFSRLDQKTNGQYDDYNTVGSALSATLAANSDDQPEAVVTFDPKQYYLSTENNNNTKLIGLYPQATPNAGVIELGINGTNDIMLSDELTGNKADPFGGSSKVFSFAHQLTQLKFLVYAADDAAKTVWGNIPANGIVLKNQVPTCKITLPSTVEFTGIEADLQLPAVEIANDAPISYPVTLPVGQSSLAACGYAMIAPVTTGSLTFEITTEKGGKREVTLSQNFGVGKAYNVVLKFTATEIQPKATIAEWQNGGQVDVTL